MRLLIFVLLLSCPTLQAAQLAYGEDFVRAGAVWADGGEQQTVEPMPLPAPDEAQNYEQEIAELEREQGPYSDALAEPLAGLGRFYREQGDLLQARKLYRRALHVVRLNDGLYSPRQLPILRELLSGYWASGDIESLDQRYDYYFRLFGQGQPPYTAARLQAALTYLRWQRRVLRLNFDANADRRLLDLYRLNDDLLTAVANDPNQDRAVLAALVQSQLRNLYLLQYLIEPPMEKIGWVAATPSHGDDWAELDVNRQRLAVMRRGSQSKGVELLQMLLARTPSDQPVEQAKWRLALADWYAWNGADARAQEEYSRVAGTLQQAGCEQLLRNWLGEPVELPDNGAFWQPRPPVRAREKILAHATLDISATGRASHVVVAAADPGQQDRASRLRRKLTRTRFRPRFVGGQAQPVTSWQRDYILYD